MTENLSSPLKRISSLDALRGFALLGIITMHMLQHFGFRLPAGNDVLFQYPQLDAAIQWVGSNIVMGRFINIFAFLFGMSLFIQIDKAAQRGVDFRLRFVWRMVLLMAFGILCHSFYNVEIISVYAFFGLLLLCAYRLRNCVLLIIAIALLVGVPRIVQVHIHNQQVANNAVSEQSIQLRQNSSESVPEHIANPSFLNDAKHSYAERLDGKLNYQFGFIGRGYVTFALFILGLLVGRSRFLENAYQNKDKLLRFFLAFFTLTISLYAIQSLIPDQNTRLFFRADGVHLPWLLVFAQTLNDLSLVVFSGAMICGFLLVYYSQRFGRFLEVLAPYGRMALTNYIMQGVIGSLLFAPWALGYFFDSWGAFALVMLGLLIYLIQGLISYIWLKRCLYGPLEWLWRSGTYLAIQPFSRAKRAHQGSSN